MRKKLREAHYFFYSQAFADGFRDTVVIVLQALIGSYLNYFQTGLIISPPVASMQPGQVRLSTCDLL
jgi:hypothetical protein